MALNRKQKRELVLIIREHLDPNVTVRFDDDGAGAKRVQRDEEGYICETLYVTPESNGSYLVEYSCNARDCDGRISNYSDYLVRRCKKRTRAYYSKSYWDGKRKLEVPKLGRFHSGLRFRVIKRLDEQRRDYAAEAAGY